MHAESAYLLYGTDEWHADQCAVERYLTRLLAVGKSTIFIAVNNHNEIAGFICGIVPQNARLSHVMQINIGVLRTYRRLGFGKQLAEKLCAYAQTVGIERAEAAIIRENKHSLHLCQQFGFAIEGVKRNAIKINDERYDEVMLSVLL
ncbi:MAG: hypothetical protein ACD_46C00238G0001 [uncultured bacterium]|nr:MAG: hypothetical protein ACD_46C00238G0001 [uncultured bacterium]